MNATTATSDPPEILYHYTDVAGLIGILRQCGLRATYSKLMNDRLETQAGGRIIRELCEAHLEREVAQAAWSKYGEAEGLDNVFVTCFSSRQDDLSLWRGYGPDGGYAIGFRSEHLRGVMQEPGPERVELMRVSYDEKEFAERVMRAVTASYSPGVVSNLLRLSAGFKDAAWRDEDEWRLVTIHHTDCGHPAPKLHSRPGILGPTPYIEVGLGVSERTWPEALIESVWTGPGSYAAERAEGVGFLLRQVGLNPTINYGDVAVHTSRVPLRL